MTDNPDPRPHGAGVTLHDCPICCGKRLHYAFSAGPHRVVRCADCRLMLVNPRPHESELAATAQDTSMAWVAFGTDSHWQAADGGDGRSAGRLARAGDWLFGKTLTARDHLDRIARYRGQSRGRILEIVVGHGGLADEARRRGCDVTRVRLSPGAEGRRLVAGTIVCGDLDSAGLDDGGYDVCVLAGAIDRVPDPAALLHRVRQLLAPDGTLALLYPELDAPAGGLLRRGRPYLPGRLTCFDRDNLQTALHQAGYRGILLMPPRRGILGSVLGRGCSGRGDTLVLATAGLQAGRLHHNGLGATSAPPTLSVVVPAYNEAATVGPLLEALLEKRVPGVSIEVVVVESNSTDGTREIVQGFAAHPRVNLVLEDRPRGKGHAVRTGLSHSTGDFVLIQDADLEYDLEDYEVLLEPLLSGREAFVLGARHGGGAWWKMRQFNEQRALSLFFNLGHWFFTTLLNTLFRQKLRDPFTMYKVFRRDCLFGLEFRCNRFDFDYELLIKLVQKGYRPIEIPVNYRSRSFKEGKKVSTFRDPFNWLKALAWLRFTRIDPLATIERERAMAEVPAAPPRAEAA